MIAGPDDSLLAYEIEGDQQKHQPRQFSEIAV